jgi:hypothetical protein
MFFERAQRSGEIGAYRLIFQAGEITRGQEIELSSIDKLSLVEASWRAQAAAAVAVVA